MYPAIPFKIYTLALNSLCILKKELAEMANYNYRETRSNESIKNSTAILFSPDGMFSLVKDLSLQLHLFEIVGTQK
jgi:hypothetical protein